MPKQNIRYIPPFCSFTINKGNMKNNVIQCHKLDVSQILCQCIMESQVCFLLAFDLMTGSKKHFLIFCPKSFIHTLTFSQDLHHLGHWEFMTFKRKKRLVVQMTNANSFNDPKLVAYDTQNICIKLKRIPFSSPLLYVALGCQGQNSIVSTEKVWSQFYNLLHYEFLNAQLYFVWNKDSSFLLLYQV